MASLRIDIRRLYDEKTPTQGHRVLVDRVWPRGVSKEPLALDEWCKHLAPSTELRKWFGHDPDRWKEFQRRYRKELEEQAEELERLRAIARKKRVVLLFGAKEEEHNQAVVLRDVLRGK